MRFLFSTLHKNFLLGLLNKFMKLYVVRNKEGKFFKNIGYGGSGGNWQDTIDKAKFYAKFGQAKSRCTFFYKNYPSFGCPDILEFDIDASNALVHDMQSITKKSIIKSKVIEIKRDINHAESRQESDTQK